MLQGDLDEDFEISGRKTGDQRSVRLKILYSSIRSVAQNLFRLREFMYPRIHVWGWTSEVSILMQLRFSVIRKTVSHVTLITYTNVLLNPRFRVI